MKYRHGTCSSCGAHFRVPASFQADRAKCKSCGGVVEIGPVDGGEGAPAAKAKPVPAKPVPARGQASKPAHGSPGARRPTAAAGGQKDSVRAAAEAAAERVRGAGRKTADKATGTPARAGGARSTPVRGGGRAARAQARRQPPAKKRSPAAFIVSIVVLLGIGGGAAWFFTRDDGATQAAETVDTAAAMAATTPEETTEPVEEPVAEEAPPEEVPAEETPEPEPEPEPPKAEEDIDLTAFPDEEKLSGTSEEDWAAIQDWMATFVDPGAGAAGNRARAKLQERGREAFPAILNAFKRLDFTTDDGFRAGDTTQRLLMDICNGQNFGWKYEHEEGYVLFDKKVVRSWIKAWEQGREHPQAWAKLTKTDLADAEKLFEKTGPFLGEGAPIKADALDDF